MAEVTAFPGAKVAPPDATYERLDVLRTLLNGMVQAICDARNALEANAGDTAIEALVVSQLTQLGWTAEVARRIAGPGSNHVGGPEDWTFGDDLAQRVRRIQREAEVDHG